MTARDLDTQVAAALDALPSHVWTLEAPPSWADLGIPATVAEWSPLDKAINAAKGKRWVPKSAPASGGVTIADGATGLLSKYTREDIDAEIEFDQATTVEEAIAAEAKTRATGRRILREQAGERVRRARQQATVMRAGRSLPRAGVLRRGRARCSLRSGRPRAASSASSSRGDPDSGDPEPAGRHIARHPRAAL